MSRKRAVEVPQQAQAAMPAESTKRSCHSPLHSSESSVASSSEVSQASAARSSPTICGELMRQSSASSMPSGDDLDDLEESSSSEESSLLESDDDEDNEDHDEVQVVTIGGPQKPRIVREGVLGGAPDLKARISALLPQLAAANEDLQLHGSGANMEEVQEGEQHIEMDLGLGVLEEKYGSYSSSDEDAEEEDADEDADIDAQSALPEHTQDLFAAKEKDTSVLSKLMGQKGGTSTKPVIQELG